MGRRLPCMLLINRRGSQEQAVGQGTTRGKRNQYPSNSQQWYVHCTQVLVYLQNAQHTDMQILMKKSYEEIVRHTDLKKTDTEIEVW
ncbi:hypothetical protein FRX31_002148 [Thalictrum thalictroides]|uniref:Uncharacterized protein n=1 Tax=Thalictrum thalictroides TaxID=46969 RepID=A0A7J6XEU4_THATH|nr:hypothetical protein FRX31_002148 [Thalictrum thalictroides]